MDDSFFQSLNTDTVVLTANRRLATYLQNEYARYQFNKKKTVWETPAIQPLSTWLNKLWEQLENEKTILSASQERALWKKISKQSWSSIPSIQQAWSLLSNWDIALDALKDNENLSVNKFYEWASEFASTCQSNHWLSSCEIAKSLINNPSLKNNLPKKIIIIGFDSVTPIIQELLEKLKNHIAIKIIETHNAKSSVKRFEFENKEDELTSMALWALKEYQNDPTQKIACVIPNLSQIRNQVVRIFSDVFNGKVEFNISAGQSLLSFLLTQTALQIIALSNDTIEDAQWSSLLQSPYLTTCPEDLDIAAEVDKKRCASNFTRIKAKTLLPLFTALQKRFPKSTYLKRWTQLIQLQKNNLEQETIENWIDWFVQILQALQWPGSRTLNSIEHQVMQRFLKALDELKETSDILGLMDFDEVYSLLQQFINDIVFQPKGEDAPIQILGVLETAGLSFDQLWLAGLDNENWPAKATPNPFLPHRLQMDCNMPHASAARELSFTESSMKRLLASAPYIMLSNANNEDDKKLSPSELITKYEKLNFEEKAKESITALPMENIKDEKGQPLTHNKIQGGTAVLKFQAICPFKAYAHFRLGAETIESPSLNLSAKLRGQLLHEALELIWKSIGTQAKLISLSEEALKETISNAIDESISHQTIPEA
ncbi:MAG: hypothetical protein KDH94_02615, partial [Coxiellaceae bacterium]|nr:hypothetical protein [Coxiellaceae bacterium]